MTVEKKKSRIVLFCILSVMLFLCTVMASELVLAADLDSDGDGIPDTTDKCPQSYGLVEGCFFFSQSLKTNATAYTAANIVLPACTDPATCKCQETQSLDMALPGDTLLVQIKGTTHVSKPFEVQ